MMKSKKTQTKLSLLWLKHFEVRGLILGFVYVLLMISIGQISHQKNNLNHQKSANIGEGLNLSHLLKDVKKVRRESRYDSKIAELSASLLVRTRYEQCSALLIDEQMIITQGDCAQSLGFDHLQGQTWRVSSNQSNRVKHLQNDHRLHAKVIKSQVHPNLGLAVHLLDQALPYAPLNLPKAQHSYGYHESGKLNLTQIKSSEFAGFIVYRHPTNGKLILSGKKQKSRYIPFNSEALAWLDSSQQSLLEFKAAMPKIEKPSFSPDTQLIISKL